MLSISLIATPGEVGAVASYTATDTRGMFTVSRIATNAQKVFRNSTQVAVVQAKSLHEANLCVQAYKDLGYKKIAFSYGASYYNDICPHPNQDLGKAIGRFMVISTMFRDKTIVNTDRIHLLGTASPIEFGMYKNMPFIAMGKHDIVAIGNELKVPYQNTWSCYKD